MNITIPYGESPKELLERLQSRGIAARISWAGDLWVAEISDTDWENLGHEQILFVVCKLPTPELDADAARIAAMTATVSNQRVMFPLRGTLERRAARMRLRALGITDTFERGNFIAIYEEDVWVNGLTAVNRALYGTE